MLLFFVLIVSSFVNGLILMLFQVYFCVVIIRCLEMSISKLFKPDIILL